MPKLNKTPCIVTGILGDEQQVIERIKWTYTAGIPGVDKACIQAVMQDKYWCIYG